MPDTFWEGVEDGIQYQGGTVHITGTEEEAGDTLGPELITNGTFTGNADGWYLYDDANGSASYNDNNVTVSYTGVEDYTDISTTTDFTIESGKTYELSFDISNATDDVVFYFNNTTDADCPDHCMPIDSTSYPDVSYGDGHHTFTFTSGYDGTDVLSFASYNWNTDTGWTIDNVSVREVVSGAPAPLFTVSNSSTASFSIAGNSVYIGNTIDNPIWDTVGRAKLNIFAGTTQEGAYSLNDGVSVSFGSMSGHVEGDSYYYICNGLSCSNAAGPSNSGPDDAAFSGTFSGIATTFSPVRFVVTISGEGENDTFDWEERSCSESHGILFCNTIIDSGSYTIDAVPSGGTGAVINQAISIAGSGGSSLFAVGNSGSFNLGYNSGEPILSFDGTYISAGAQMKFNHGIIDSTDSLGGADQVLTTDGSGNLLWADPVSTSTIVFQTNSTNNGNQSLLNLIAGSNITLVDNGSGGVTISSSTPTLRTNGTNNTSQSILNLIAGANVSLSANGSGGVTINSSSPFSVNANNTLYSSGLSGTGQGGGGLSNILIGTSAGGNSTGSLNSAVLIGANAGAESTNIAGTGNANIFIGGTAGMYTSDVDNSIFLGQSAGNDADNALRSVFIGYSTGGNADNVIDSNFIGQEAGVLANVTGSNFIGSLAGANADNASYSVFIGYSAGNEYYIGAPHMGSNNIIIGTNISLPDGTADSINIGGVLFGNGTQSDTVQTNPYLDAVSTGKIGIATIPTTYTLEVGNSSVSGAVAQFTNGTGSCRINPTTTSLDCSSDERLKTNIKDLDNTLEALLNVRTVTYNWNSAPNASKQTGFLAQDLKQHFPQLVSQDSNGFYSVNYAGMTPLLTKAIQEINTNITDISDLTRENSWRDALIEWFADAANGIRSLVVQDEICVDSQCLNSDDIRFLLELKAEQQGSGAPQEPEPTPIPEEVPAEELPSEEPAASDEAPAEEPPALPEESTVPSEEVPEPTATPTEETV